MFYAIPANDFEKAATAVGGIYAPTENGNPRNSKGMAGMILKLVVLRVETWRLTHVKRRGRARINRG